MAADPKISQELCLACGLCCNGVLFKDVELQSTDDAGKLAALGLPLKMTRTKTRFGQPCTALCAGNRCEIYRDRPSRCRDFECALLQSVQAGEREIPAALKVIQGARQRAEKVRRLLRELGDLDESMALSRRFRRMQRRMESEEQSEAAVGIYGDLTLAVHDLNLALRHSFYP